MSAIRDEKRRDEAREELKIVAKRKCCFYIYAQVSPHKPSTSSTTMMMLLLADDDDDALQIVITQNGSLQFPTWRIINAIPHSKLSAEKSKNAASAAAAAARVESCVNVAYAC